MADTVTKNSKPKSFDISPPGKSKPDATARPVIIKRGPIMPDPMVKIDIQSATDPAEPNEPEPKDTTPAKRTRKVIEVPVGSELNESSVQPEADIQPPATPKDDESVKSDTQDTPEPDGGDSATDITNDPAEQKRRQAAADKAQLERRQQLDDWVEQKKYFLPINAHSHGRGQGVWLVVLVPILLAVGAAALAYYKIIEF